MRDDKLQTSRYEWKYVITEDTARQIRGYVRSFLDLDENCAGQPGLSYPVHSLYLDSADMRTYWDTINGHKNRFKLRVRFYEDPAGAPVFVEIKRRMNHCIVKERAAVMRESLPDILAGQLPPMEALALQLPKQLVALQNFCRLVEELRAVPKVHVAYVREAYVPRGDNLARLTMDRRVQSEPQSQAILSTSLRNPILVWGNAVILEFKFTSRFPTWFSELARIFELRQCGAAKYSDGVTLLSGHLPQHRNKPHPNADLRWPVDNECRPAQNDDLAETPSHQSVVLAVRGHPAKPG